MGHTPHELAADFPEFADELHSLKLDDPHFQKLAQRYHEINRAIHRAETKIEPTTDEHQIIMRKERMALKDDIYGILKATAGQNSSS